MMYEKWVGYLTGEMKVPYISEIDETAPEEIKKEYWAFRKKLEEAYERDEPVPAYL